MTFWERLSPRERTLLVSLVFLAELALGYLVLLDPDMTKLGRLAEQEVSAHKALDALADAGPGASPTPMAGASTAPNQPVLPVPSGEPFDLALQRYMDEQITAAGATPLAVQLPTPGPGASPSAYHDAHVSAGGPYPAIAALVDRLGRAPYRLGLSALTVRPDPADPKRLVLDADVFVESATRRTSSEASRR